MKQSQRPLSEPDRLAWTDYIRHVRTLHGRDPPAPPPPAKLAATSPAAPATPVAPPPQIRRTGPPDRLSHGHVIVTGQQPAGLDSATWSRFRTGKLVAARTLDLHGKTAQGAFHALERFLLTAHAEQVRCVEIVTGRGSGENGGVIRRELPLWLNLPSLRPFILAASHPHPRNPGSTRLLLRRPR
jgi:DNA-nicking Smr family endonuclease